MPAPHVTVLLVSRTPAALVAAYGPSAALLPSSTSRSTVTRSARTVSISVSAGCAVSPAPALAQVRVIPGVVMRMSALTAISPLTPITWPGVAAARAAKSSASLLTMKSVGAGHAAAAETAKAGAFSAAGAVFGSRHAAAATTRTRETKHVVQFIGRLSQRKMLMVTLWFDPMLLKLSGEIATATTLPVALADA